MNNEKMLDAWAWRFHDWGVRPNHLTLLQAPLLVWLLWAGYTGDFLVFAVAQIAVVLVDGADGTLARRTHTTSHRGHLLDSLFDIVGIGITLWVADFHYGTEPLYDTGLTVGQLAITLLIINFLVYIQNEIQGTKSITYTRGPVTAGLFVTATWGGVDFLILGLLLPSVVGLVLMVTRVDWRKRLWNYYQFLTAGRRHEYKAIPRHERARLVNPTGTNLPPTARSRRERDSDDEELADTKERRLERARAP